MQKILTIIIATFLTVATVNAQIYHEECKEDLRAIARQGTNYQKLGLTVADTLTWYENESWVEKIPTSSNIQFYRGINWVQTESKLRIKEVLLTAGFEGKFKFNSPVLEHLELMGNKITELDVSQNINLTFLGCGGNNLTNLDVSKNTNLIRLYCYSNNLTEIDISNNLKLEWLLCNENNLTAIDVSKNLALTTLEVTNNNLSELDVSKNINLRGLYCINTNLTKLDLRNNMQLRDVYCMNNKLTEFQILHNADLLNLDITNNFLKFSTLPIIDNIWRFVYDPQETIKGGTINYTDGVDLSSEYNVNGHITTYEWFDITTTLEQPITQPTNVNGVFTFTEEHANKRLRCKMRNAQFAGYEWAPFILIYEVNTGETFPQFYNSECKEDLREILRKEINYRRLGLRVSDTLSWYDEETWVPKVHRISWIETESELKRLDTVSWMNYDNMPGGGNPLAGKIKFNSPYLTFLILTGNNITELDLSKNTELKYLNCFANGLTELDLSNNLELEYLDCRGNNLSELDLSKNINLDTVILSQNKFKFSTLPILDIASYQYAQQQIINGGTIETTVDLSSEYNINGKITTFEWFYIPNNDMPWIEEEIAQPINENGIFIFNEEHIGKRLRCRMRNAQFPDYEVPIWGDWTELIQSEIIYEVEIKAVNVIEPPENNFVIFPNPARDKLTIHHSKEIENILLYDLSGKLLRTYTVSETNKGAYSLVVIDISDLDSGVYFISVDGNAVKFVKEP